MLSLAFRSPPLHEAVNSRKTVAIPLIVSRYQATMREHAALVFRVLRRLGLSLPDAEDAGQEVFLVLHRRLNDIEPGAERTFLLSTARRVASTRRRHQKRHPEDPSSELDATALNRSSPEGELQRRQGLEILDQILDAMPEDVRIVFILYEMEGMSGDAIAKSLDLPEGTVSTRLRRGRQLFVEATQRLASRERFLAARGGFSS